MKKENLLPGFVRAANDALYSLDVLTAFAPSEEISSQLAEHVKAISVILAGLVKSE